MKARARCELKQISVKMSDVSENSEFCYPKKKKKGKARWSYNMYLLTELGRAGRENIWPEVMAYGPSAARSVRHDRGKKGKSAVVI